jgi:hypothetical protein
MLREILSSIQSRGLADAASTGHAYCAIRGRCCVIEGSGPAHSQSQSTIFRVGAIDSTGPDAPRAC